MRSNILLPLVSSIVLVAIGYLILNSNIPANQEGYNLIRYLKALVWGGSALSIIFALIFIFPKSFSAWKKFAIWFVPLAALLFIFYPEPGSGDLFSPYPEQVFQWVSGLYIVISAIIILCSALRRKKSA